MKSLTFILTVIFTIFLSNIFAQEIDTSVVGDTIIDLQDNLNIKLNKSTEAIYVLNISKMIFWQEYGEKFIIGVTDKITADEFRKFFKERYIHGHQVQILYITHTISPFVNIIYIPQGKNNNLAQIINNYQGKNVIFLSANRIDWTIVDFVIKPTNNDIVIRANKKNLNQKNVIITPLLKGLSMIY